MTNKIVSVIGPDRKIVKGELYKESQGGLVTIKISENEYITGTPVKGKK